jgi:phosphate transport system substrate-binding protein
MDASGIGYVGAGYIFHDGKDQPIKVLKITAKIGKPAVSPLDEQAIMQRRYYFQRPLYQFIPATSWNKVAAFIAFEKGPTGQQIIKTSGYYILSSH